MRSQVPIELKNNGDTDTPVQNNRDKDSHNTDADQGSAVKGTPQKDTDSSIGDHGPFS